MTILVTGSAGFIGYHLCKRLLEEGKKVIGVDNINSDYSPELKNERIKHLREYKTFEFIKLDILNEGLGYLLKRKKIDYIIHLAGKDVYYTGTSSDYIEYSGYLDVNVTGTAKMYELAQILGVKRFIFTSTYSVYGNTKAKIATEKNTKLSPTSPHGSSKLAAEQTLYSMSKFFGIPVTILRISSVYGPEMRPGTILPKIIDRLRRKKKIDLFSDIHIRDYIYIDDVVEYIISALKVRGKYQVFNICSGVSISIEKLVSEVAKVMGLKSKIGFIKEDRDFERILVKRVELSNKKAKKILRFTSEYDLEEGLPLTVSWYLGNEDVLAKSVDSVQ